MMHRILATLAVLVLSASSVVAQQPPEIGRPPGIGSPGYRPPVSPYLNLGRVGTPAIDYYGIVRPQLEGMQAIQQLQQQMNVPGAGIGGLQGIDPVTGLPVVPGAAGNFAGAGGPGPLPAGFFTHGQYYMTVRPTPGTGFGGGGGGGGGQGVHPQPGFGVPTVR
jgi:hypothetical protein